MEWRVPYTALFFVKDRIREPVHPASTVEKMLYKAAMHKFARSVVTYCISRLEVRCSAEVDMT